MVEFWHIGAIGNVDLLTQGKELIEDIPRRQSTMQNGNSFSSNPFLSGASELPSRASTTDQFVEKSIKSIVTWTAGRLSNYRQLVDAGPIPALLSVLFACQRCLGSGSSQTVEVNTLLLSLISYCSDSYSSSCFFLYSSLLLILTLLHCFLCPLTCLSCVVLSRLTRQHNWSAATYGNLLKSLLWVSPLFSTVCIFVLYSMCSVLHYSFVMNVWQSSIASLFYDLILEYLNLRPYPRKAWMFVYSRRSQDSCFSITLLRLWHIAIQYYR